MSLLWDFETRGVVNLKTQGVYVYAQHPSTMALLASFKLKTGDTAAHRAWIAAGGPVNTLCRWKRGEPCPPYVRAYVEAGGEISAWNATFERLIWWNVMVPRHGWPRPAMTQFRCTAVTAAAMSMPRDLERCGEALGLKIQKDKRGKALMKIHSIPTGFSEDGSAIWHPLVDDPTSMDAYHDYCDFDVLSEEEAAERLIPLSDYEMRVYWLNERINDKGLRIDTVSARAALRLIAKAKDKINEKLAAVTGNAVTAVTQAARLKAWCEAQGVAMPSMDKDDVDEFLHSDRRVGDDTVQRALELRAEGAKPSVDKISAMLGRVGTDGRARGVYLHHGAGQTGRFSSRGVQAHNMPKYRKIFEDARINQDTLFKAIRSEDPEVLTELYGAELGRPLHLLSDAVRGFIWAATKHEFLVADYSSIEGRLAAWFAGEEWKLEAFRALDRGEGHGIYELAAAGIYGIPVADVTRSHRSTGKVAELSCIEEGQMVLTDTGLVAIEHVPLYSKVWDGVEWVNHDGPVFRGYKEVIEYAGLRATEDHIVFTEDGRQVRFGDAAREQDRLAQTGSFGRPIRLGGSDKPRSDVASARQARQGRSHLPLPLSSMSLHELRGGKVNQSRQSDERQNAGLCSLHATETRAELVKPARHSSTSALHEQERSAVSSLWRSGDSISIQVGLGVLPLDYGKFYARPGYGDGPDRQRWPLRAGQHSDDDKTSESEQPQHYRIRGNRRRHGASERRISSFSTPLPARPLCGSHSHSTVEQIEESCGDRGAVVQTVVQAKRAVWDILNAGPRHRFTVSGRLVHNCQYQTGVGGIKKFARQNKIALGGIYGPLWAAADVDAREYADKRFAERVKAHDPNTAALGREGWIAAELIKVGWRAKHPMIVAMWKALEEAAVNAANNPGQKFSVTRPGGNAPACTYLVKQGFLWCLLPSGRALAYGAPKMALTEAPWADKTLDEAKREQKMSLTVRGVDTQTEKWSRFPIYGGSLFNNCLGAQTEVLTPSGLKRITEITKADRLWDGEAWIAHGGVVCQGRQHVMAFGAVLMTPDHKIWTANGWKPAEKTSVYEAHAASPIPDSLWSDLWSLDRDGICRGRWKKELLDGALRVRHGEDGSRFGIEKRANGKLRLFQPRANEEACNDARHVRSQRVSGAPEHDGSLLLEDSFCLSALRRSRNYGLRALARLQEFLGRYGTVVGKRVDAGADAKRRGVFSGELYLGESDRTESQPPRQCRDRYAEGANADERRRRNIGDQQDDSLLPGRRGLAGGKNVRRAGSWPQSDGVTVYDIINAGPHHRFTIWNGGRTMLVSNCIQGTARDILVDGLLKTEERYGTPSLHTHDEIGVEVVRGSASVAEYEAMLAEMPDWAAGLPMSSKAFLSKRYKKD